MERLKKEREEEEQAAKEKTPNQASDEAGSGQEKEKKEKKPASSAKKKAEQLTIEVATGESDAQFVASKTGKKYYLIDSAAGKKIREENRVYFKNEKEAEKAGYGA
jgi:outer membrane biosynthesis protein TonB